MEIRLVNNNGFKWINKNNIFFKGYIYLNNRLNRAEEIFEMFEDIEDFYGFKMKLKELNGCFAVVIKKESNTWAATDKSRSFPLYYSSKVNIITDKSDEITSDVNFIDDELDDVSLSELILSSYVYGENTVYKNLKQIDIGQAIEFSWNIKKDYYYKHMLSDKKENQIKSLTNEFKEVSERIFKRLINSIDGRPIIIPLSGGYDSRYIISMIKKFNYNNVICYTYGNYEDYEVQYSKRVAKKLGYKWHFIDYSQDKWNEVFSEDFISYCNYYYNHESIPHIQEFIALRELKEKKALPEDGVVVTGFCGDLPAGSFVLPKEDEKIINFSNEWITTYIFNENYNHIRSSSKQKNEIKKRITNKIDGENISDFDGFMESYERWFTGARPSKWVVNSNRVYEYFGHEWRMPLWDDEFLAFWNKVDNDLRYETKLYKNVLFSWLFEPFEIDFHKPSYIRTLSIEYKKSSIRKLKLSILTLFTYIFIKTGFNIWKRDNTNNYNTMAILLYSKVNNKKIVGYNKINVHQMMALWWAEQIYGSNYVKKVFDK